jgi:hypothetical protein
MLTAMTSLSAFFGVQMKTPRFCAAETALPPTGLLGFIIDPPSFADFPSDDGIKVCALREEVTEMESPYLPPIQ